MTTTEHEAHASHDHGHGPDYAHDGHRHAGHDGHYDEH